MLIATWELCGKKPKQMKRLLSLVLSLVLFVPALFAQVEESVESYEETAQVAESVAEPVAEQPVPIMQIVILVLVCAVALAIIVHMLYVCIFRKKLREDYTVAEFETQRIAEGQSPKMTDEDMAICERLDQIRQLWTDVPTGPNETTPMPLKMRHITKARELVDAALATKPTDEDVVEMINGVNTIINESLKRQFNGSKTMIVISALVAAALTWMMGDPAPAILIGSGILLYIFASRTPIFVLVRKEMKGGGNRRSFLTLIFGGLFAAVATAPTYKTTTYYSDGSEETETDNSHTWFSLILTFVVAVMLAIFLWAIALINYLRNYWLYV